MSPQQCTKAQTHKRCLFFRLLLLLLLFVLCVGETFAAALCARARLACFYLHRAHNPFLPSSLQTEAARGYREAAVRKSVSLFVANMFCSFVRSFVCLAVSSVVDHCNETSRFPLRRRDSRRNVQRDWRRRACRNCLGAPSGGRLLLPVVARRGWRMLWLLLLLLLLLWLRRWRWRHWSRNLVHLDNGSLAAA